MSNDRLSQLQQYLQQSPDDCFLHHATALELLKQGDEQGALFHFEKNLAFDHHYIGTYYHLAKLYERLQQPDKAIATYEKGMHIAKSLNDQHSYNELQSAYEDLTD